MSVAPGSNKCFEGFLLLLTTDWSAAFNGGTLGPVVRPLVFSAYEKYAFRLHNADIASELIADWWLRKFIGELYRTKQIEATESHILEMIRAPNLLRDCFWAQQGYSRRQFALSAYTEGLQFSVIFDPEDRRNSWNHCGASQTTPCNPIYICGSLWESPQLPRWLFSWEWGKRSGATTGKRECVLCSSIVIIVRTIIEILTGSWIFTGSFVEKLLVRGSLSPFQLNRWEACSILVAFRKHFEAISCFRLF